MSRESWLAADIQNPAKPVESCCSIYLTYPYVRCFEGKMLLICIGSSPKRLRFMGKGWDWLRALSQLSLCGAQPSFLISQLRSKRTGDAWSLGPGRVFRIPLDEDLPGPHSHRGALWKAHTVTLIWLPGGLGLQFSIASQEMQMIRTGEETLI